MLATILMAEGGPRGCVDESDQEEVSAQAARAGTDDVYTAGSVRADL